MIPVHPYDVCMYVLCMDVPWYSEYAIFVGVSLIAILEYRYVLEYTRVHVRVLVEPANCRWKCGNGNGGKATGMAIWPTILQ